MFEDKKITWWKQIMFFASVSFRRTCRYLLSPCWIVRIDWRLQLTLSWTWATGSCLVNTHKKKVVASEAVRSKTLTLSSQSAQWCWLEEPQGGDQTHCTSLHSDPSRCGSSPAALMPETQPRARRPPAPSHPVDGWSVDTVQFYGFYFEVLPVVQRVHSWASTGTTLTCRCCLPYNWHFLHLNGAFSCCQVVHMLLFWHFFETFTKRATAGPYLSAELWTTCGPVVEPEVSGSATRLEVSALAEASSPAVLNRGQHKRTIQRRTVCLLVRLHREGRQTFIRTCSLLECVGCMSTVLLHGSKLPTEARTQWPSNRWELGRPSFTRYCWYQQLHMRTWTILSDVENHWRATDGSVPVCQGVN